MMPEPSAARGPSFSQARLKIVGNMIEFIRPTASSEYPATVPVELAEIAINVIAPVATVASSRPGLTRRSRPEPIKRPPTAPPQKNETSLPAELGRASRRDNECL